MRILLMLLALCVCPNTSLANDNSTPQDKRAMAELREASWVKDLYVSPGHMNIGVIPGEKDWDSPMIGKWTCSVLAKNGSRLTWVRFVDMIKVADQGKTVRQAEIHKVQCR